ncbi:MAG: protein translocase subunit SecD, partial [Arcobacteraceae bacterium]|nr:protein translocase subunit SecD [Arcobacteraceae bacterium]
MKIFNYRLVIFILVTLFGVIFAIPSFTQSDGKKISLGLDLQGGLHLLLGVQTQKAVESKIKSIAATVQYFADDKDILIEDLTINPMNLTFILLDDGEMTNLDVMLEDIKGLHIEKSSELEYTISLTDEQISLTKDSAVSQAVETIRNRLDQFGLAEPSVVRQGKTDIVVELPGIKTQEEEQRARELISKPANLELMAVDELKADQVYNLSEDDAQMMGNVILEDTNDPKIKYLLKQ